MDTRFILMNVARKYGVTYKEVENEIREAIRIGMVSTNPEIKKRWKKISPDGGEPSVGKFLNYILSQSK